MTNEQINTAIAKLQGWTKINEVDRGCGVPPEFTNAKDYLGRPMENPPIWDIPDYCHDLNAMHEAEKLLYENDRSPKKYTQQLKSAICREAGAKKAQIDFDICITATARQRAEAFLKTVGEWEGK